MSQDILFSVSSKQLDEYRDGEKATSETIDRIVELGAGIEYVNSLKGEYAADIKADVKYARRIGIEPETIHLSVFDELTEPEGYIELNTSYRNSHRAFDPEKGSIQPYWDPENLVFHPPIVDDNQNREEVMEQVISHISKVNEINRENEDVSGNLLIENMPPVHHTNYMINSPKDVLLMEDIAEDMGVKNDLKYVLDTGHTADCMEMARAMPSERVMEVHLHDKAKRDDGGWENHLPPGEGIIDLGEFMHYRNREIDHATTVLEVKPSEMSPESVEDSFEFAREALER